MPKKRLRNISLFGYFGSGNFGNDGSLLAMLRQIRQRLPSAELSCICLDPGKVEKEFGIQGVRIDSASPQAWGAGASGFRRLWLRMLRGLKLPHEIVSWWRTLAYLRKVDVLIAPGTGLLDDYSTTPFQIPYDLFKWCFAARLCGTKILFVSIGAGPIVHPLSRWFMKAAARWGSYRSYRDQISKDFMAGIGLDTRNDLVFPDLVFSLPVSQFPGMPVRNDTADRETVVGVGLIAYQGWGNRPELADQIYRNYIGKMTQFVLYLLAEGHAVRLLTGDVHDQSALQDVRKEVVERSTGLAPGQFTAEPVRSLNDVFQQLAATDVVAATRFHNVVCALMLGKPVVSIEYAAKNKALMAEMGLERFCQHVENVDVLRLTEQVSELAGQRQRFRVGIDQQSRAYRASLDRQFAQVLLEQAG